jgi:exopolyphosphatase/guanosine-5'-triphosphate,3'-diphosphate pyrophosphatase
VAVIDIGANSIRMTIGQIDAAGDVHKLDTLSQQVGLGKDSFSKGYIKPETVEQCVRVLKSYRQILDEYQITDPDQIRIVATSAVREASNRLSFLSRVYVATGFQIDPMDDSEVNRTTYLGIQPLLADERRFAQSQSLVIEVGGGTTVVLLLQNQNVTYAHTFRMGSLRLRKTLETYHAPATKVRSIMEDHIRKIVEQVRVHVPQQRKLELIALGGDIRYAASQLDPNRDESVLAEVSVDRLEKLTNEILSLSVDELVRKQRLTFPEAETLGLALLTYTHVARALELKNLFVSSANLRDGLLQQMAGPDAWSEDFKQQIVRSAVEMARRFHFDETHGLHVAKLSARLFSALEHEHQLGSRYELLLYLAALLHDIGYAVSTQSHHKHSMYLIQNSELFGISKKDLLLIALLARYHRRASPKPIHEGYASLDWQDRITVTKLAALLRVADALDRSNKQRVKDIECARENGQFVISAESADDLSLEQLALQQKSELFQEVFGMPVVLRSTSRAIES